MGMSLCECECSVGERERQFWVLSARGGGDDKASDMTAVSDFLEFEPNTLYMHTHTHTQFK